MGVTQAEVVLYVQQDDGVTLVGFRDDNVWIASEGAECRHFY